MKDKLRYNDKDLGTNFAQETGGAQVSPGKQDREDKGIDTQMVVEKMLGEELLLEKAHVLCVHAEECHRLTVAHAASAATLVELSAI